MSSNKRHAALVQTRRTLKKIQSATVNVGTWTRRRHIISCRNKNQKIGSLNDSVCRNERVDLTAIRDHPSCFTESKTHLASLYSSDSTKSSSDSWKHTNSQTLLPSSVSPRHSAARWEVQVTAARLLPVVISGSSLGTTSPCNLVNYESNSD